MKLTRTYLDQKFSIHDEYCQGVTSMDLDIYPVELVNRMAAELQAAQLRLSSIPAPGDSARLNAVLVEWEGFNE